MLSSVDSTLVGGLPRNGGSGIMAIAKPRVSRGTVAATLLVEVSSTERVFASCRIRVRERLARIRLELDDVGAISLRPQIMMRFLSFIAISFCPTLLRPRASRPVHPTT